MNGTGYFDTDVKRISIHLFSSIYGYYEWHTCVFLPLKSIYIDRRHIFDFMFSFNVDYKPLYVIKMCYCKETKYILKFIKQKDYRKQQQRYSAAVNTRYY